MEITGKFRVSVPLSFPNRRLYVVTKIQRRDDSVKREMLAKTGRWSFLYQGADKSLVRTERKQATATKL